jgi:NAD kinase
VVDAGDTVRLPDGPTELPLMVTPMASLTFHWRSMVLPEKTLPRVALKKFNARQRVMLTVKVACRC